MNKSRVIFGSLLLLSVLSGAAPLVVLLSLIGVFRYGRYWEFLVAGFLFELLYGTGIWSLPLPFPMFIGSAVLFVLAEMLRTKVR